MSLPLSAVGEAALLARPSHGEGKPAPTMGLGNRSRVRLDRLAVFAAAAVRLLVIAFLLAPIVVVVAMSLDGRDFLGRFPPPFLSLKWYERFVSNSFYLNGLVTSLILATCTAVISTILGLAAAIGIDRYRFPGRDALTTLLLSPAIVPAVVLGFGLLLLWSLLGIQNGLVKLLSGHVIITLPFTIRAILAGLGGINPHCLDAASSLGATEWRKFLDVTFPLAKTGIVAGAIFAFAFSFDDVAVSLFLTDTETYTLPVALLSMMRASFDLSVAAAAVVFVAVTILIIVVLDRVAGIERLVGQGIYRG